MPMTIEMPDGTKHETTAPPKERTLMDIAKELEAAQAHLATARHNAATYADDIKRLNAEVRNFGRRPRKVKP